MGSKPSIAEMTQKWPITDDDDDGHENFVPSSPTVGLTHEEFIQHVKDTIDSQHDAMFPDDKK